MPSSIHMIGNHLEINIIENGFLLTIYKDGYDNISYHNNIESLNTRISEILTEDSKTTGAEKCQRNERKM